MPGSWDDARWDLPAFLLFSEKTRKQVSQTSEKGTDESKEQPAHIVFAKLTHRITEEWRTAGIHEQRAWKKKAYDAHTLVAQQTSALSSTGTSSPAARAGQPQAAGGGSLAGSSERKISGDAGKATQSGEKNRVVSTQAMNTALEHIYQAEPDTRPAPKRSQSSYEYRDRSRWYGHPLGPLVEMLMGGSMEDESGRWCEECQCYHDDY